MSSINNKVTKSDSDEAVSEYINNVTPNNGDRSLEVLNKTELLKPEDLDFFSANIDKFHNRFITRPYYRSRYEIENYVVDNQTHPTPDAKYWQLIGEQSTHVEELIASSFDYRETQIELDRLTDSTTLEDKYSEQLRQLEIERKQFKLSGLKKNAKERIREIRNCETLINELLPLLKHGANDYEKHIEEREVLRNIIKSGTQINYASFDAATDPIFLEYMKKPANKILVVCPHRTSEDVSITNFNLLQPPNSYSLQIEQPVGFSVPDVRNLACKLTLTDGYEWLFFVDDDVIIPRNTLVQLMSLNEKFCGGMYYRKYTPLESVPMMYKDGKPSNISYNDYEIGDVIKDLAVLPSGCTLIHRSVIEAASIPYYKSFTIQGRPALTEDTYFCGNVAKQNNYPVLDTSVQCLHVDKVSGVLYGHKDFVENNRINIQYSQYFCI